MRKIFEILDVINKKGLYPDIPIIDSGRTNNPYFVINEKTYLTFNSCNYLGISDHPSVIKAVVEGFYHWGIHPSNSPIVGGTWTIHKEFERKLANFFGFEDAILFSSTTMANLGVIPAFCDIPLLNFFSIIKTKILNQKNIITFSDELNHATVIEGLRLTHAKREVYRHLDSEDLKKQILKNKNFQRKLILTDGIFSMDGHIAPVDKLVKLKEDYDATLFIDDAHSLGVLGERGSGILEHYNIDRKKIDIFVTSLSKGFGLLGAVVCGKKSLIDYLRVASKTYLFTRTYPAAIAQGGIEALGIISGEEGRKRRVQLWSNTKFLTAELKKMGYDTFNTKTPLISILIGDEDESIRFSRKLFENGIYAPAIRWPAAPKGSARIRFIMTSIHSKNDIAKLLEVITRIRK